MESDMSDSTATASKAITTVRDEATRAYTVWEDGNPVPLGMIKFWLAGRFQNHQFNYRATRVSDWAEREFTNLDEALLFVTEA